MNLRASLLVTVLAFAALPHAAADALPDRSDREGHAVSFDLAAPLAEPLSWSATGLPPGIGIDPGGHVFGTLTYDAAGVHESRFTATGPAGTWTAELQWTVHDVNRAPSVVGIPLVVTAIGEPVSLRILAADPDGDALTYAASGLPDGVTLDASTGWVTGAATASGVRLVNVVVTDSAHATTLSTLFAFPWLVEGPANRAPDCAQARPTAATLWPPNGKATPVRIAGVQDGDGDAVAIRITAIASSEPAETRGIGTDTAWLPAARQGAGDGRTYTVAFTASDGHGGTCAGLVTVEAPHDMRASSIVV